MKKHACEVEAAKTWMMTAAHCRMRVQPSAVYGNIYDHNYYNNNVRIGRPGDYSGQLGDHSIG